MATIARRRVIRRVPVLLAVAAVLVGLSATAAPATFTGSGSVPANGFANASLAPPSALSVSQVCGDGTLRAVSTVAPSAWTPTTVVARPAGVVAGDVMIAQITWHDRVQTGSVTGPPGWTLIRQDGDGTEIWQWLFYKVAGAGEALAYTFTSTSTEPREAAGAIAAYAGVDTVAPIDAHGGQVGQSGTLTAPSITTTRSDTVLVGLYGQRTDVATIAPAATMTERWKVSTGKPAIEGADEPRTAVGPTGSRTAVSTDATRQWVAQLVALRPAGGGIGLRSSASGGSATGVTLSVAAPAGVTPGDVLLAAVTWDSQSGTVSAPGWTLIRADLLLDNTWQGLCWKSSAVSDAAAFTFTSSDPSADEAVGTVTAWTGVDAASPIDVHSGQGTAGSTSITAPGVTSSAAGSMLVGAFGDNLSGVITAPLSMAEADMADFGQDIALQTSYEKLPAAGPTGARVASSTNNYQNVGQLVVLKPTGGAESGAASWTPTPSGFATGYKLQRWNGPVLENEVTATPNTVTSADDGLLVAGTTYTYRLFAFYENWTSSEAVDTLTVTPCGS